jgi:Methane oxygenase PmoA
MPICFRRVDSENRVRYHAAIPSPFFDSEIVVMRRPFALALCASLVLVSLSSASADVGVKKTEGGVEVTLDGQPFAKYIANSGFKPILWPIFGPTGKEMTRAWPLRQLPPGDKSEATDHVHQKSFWFDHGNVNGVDFWAETSKEQGKQVQTELVKAEGGKVATIVTKNNWNGPDGKTLLSDVRTMRFGGDKEMRWIDFDVVVTAATDNVTFGDTKEGSFGVRIAESMRVDRKLGGKIITSEGLEDDKAWGKPAKWVDYHGPVQGETLGIAILNHPSSFRYPSHWHVRTYGLFAANPWGLHDFTGGKERSDHTMKKGDSFSLRYRVIFHKGTEKDAKIADAFAKYTKE